MVAKEWRDARWKFLIGALAFLVLVSVAPRPYEKILDDIAQQIEMTERQLKSPELLQEPPIAPPGEERGQGYSDEQMRQDMRKDIERMQSPAYAVETARGEITGVHQSAGFAVIVALAGFWGCAGLQ